MSTDLCQKTHLPSLPSKENRFLLCLVIKKKHMAYSKSQIYTSHNWLSKPLSFYLERERMGHFWVKTLLDSPALALNDSYLHISYLHCHVCRIHSFCACWPLPSLPQINKISVFFVPLSLMPDMSGMLEAFPRQKRSWWGLSFRQWSKPDSLAFNGSLASWCSCLFWDDPRNCTLCQQVPQVSLKHRRSATNRSYSLK